MNDLKVYLQSLGCDKNTVDGEVILGDLLENGFITADSVEDADLVILNSCCFIDEAKRESIGAIFNLLEEKNPDAKFILSGCMVDRYREELKQEIPEIDDFIHVNETGRLLNLFDRELERPGHRKLSGQPYAYLKISDGCNRNCTYCAIPGIKGRHVSRSMKDILEEAAELDQAGIKELILVAQDLTQYGSDIKNSSENLESLLKHLAEDFNFQWIRLLYLYPEGITDSLIELIKEKPNLLPYFDIPIQHTSNEILRRMGRKIKKETIKSTIEKIRTNLPDSIIRSTVIVGFPGETEQDFEELLQDVEDIRFDRLGSFKYSKEEGTAAYGFENHLSEDIKEDRYNRLNILQDKIMSQQNSRLIGKVVEAIIEEKEDQNTYLGRLYSDAPEIECQVYIETDKDLSVGEIVTVKVNRVIGYDFIGELYEPTK